MPNVRKPAVLNHRKADSAGAVRKPVRRLEIDRHQPH
jgi:hypothetical protein